MPNPIKSSVRSKRIYCKVRASLFVFALFHCLNAQADVADVVARVKPSVVGVGTYQAMRSPRGQLKGTGFAVGNGKIVATCYHVVKSLLDFSHKESWAIFLGHGKEMSYRLAKVVATDPEHDLALLKFEGDALPALKLGDDAHPVREGDQLYFTGFPIGAILGLNASTNRAGLAAIVPIFTPMANAAELNDRSIRQASNPYEIYQLDAIAYPGNSGSPLWDPDTGEIYGMVNAVFVKGSKEAALTDPSGISYAIPSQYIEALLNKVRD